MIGIFYKSTPLFRGTLLIMCSAILYGFMGYFGMGAVREHLSVSAMLFWRFFLAGTFISFLLLKQGSFSSSQPYLEKKILFFTFFLGAVGYAGASGFYFLSARYTGTGIAMVIFFSYPMVIAFFSWIIYQQRFTLFTLISFIAMLVGLFLLNQDNTIAHFNTWGILFGVLAAFSYTLYVMGSKRHAHLSLDPNLMTLLVCFGSAFIFFLIALFTHQFSAPTSFRGWEYLLALSFLSTALPIQLMLKGLKHVSSLRASLISGFEPLITLWIGIIILDEPISQIQLLGIVLLLTSTLFIQVQKEI